MSPKFQTHQVAFPPELAGRRLDQALAQLLPQYSRTRIQRWIEDGAVRVNGLAAKARDVVVEGLAGAAQRLQRDEQPDVGVTELAGQVGGGGDGHGTFSTAAGPGACPMMADGWRARKVGRLLPGW